MKTKIWADFQISISVPLKIQENEHLENGT